MTRYAERGRAWPDGGVEVVERRGGWTSFHPQGGGFVRTSPDEVFDDLYEPVPDGPPPPMRRTTVALDEGRTYSAWWDGARWNGWATPRFEEEEALRLLRDLEEATSGLREGLRFRWRRDGDTLMVYDGAYDDEEDPEAWEAYGPGETVTPEGPRRTWAVGAWSWTWFDLDEEA